jgi:acetyl esterase/lipase
LPRRTARGCALRIGYGPDPSQFGDLYLPAGSASVLPVVVLPHGGGWKAGSTLDLFTPYLRELATRGVAAWNLEYREVGDGGGWPNTFQDAASGVDALTGPVQRATGNRLNTRRVRAVGHSAGGHLAVWLAGRPKLPAGAPGAAPAVRLTAAVGMAPVLDLEQAATVDGDRNVVNLMGGTPTQQPARYAVGSPIRMLPVGIPVTCVHGDADTTVPHRPQPARRHRRPGRR